ncbi:pentapeptide repeat-containing protein [Burkholderia stagnalis]|uniref:pentapeptide repeat-containing protein n=1 Tax=Burkholderia stagnalis TaxID=1503054 RepID=UPI0013DF0FDC|nr:pentapeptide repeat-containing protein [Burkholderia stagnalis]
MHHIKSQATLVATTRTQIGSQSMLGISVGVGFRLSDPAVLVHETAVWEALKEVHQSVPLAELATPKSHAEWLLVGRSVHRAPAGSVGQPVDWPAWVELDGVRKTVSCRAPIESSAELGLLAQLVIDPSQAVAGSANENPFGIKATSAPLQRVRALGVGPEPLAAMGALETDWPERRKWMPNRSGSLDSLARDGTHMGWPASTDLRWFQQAAPDQWSRRDSWSLGARFELGGFGANGSGYVNALPRLSAVALMTRKRRSDVEHLMLKQQTTWFLPDRDIGVMWWNGAATIDYLLDDDSAMLVTALKDADERLDVDALMAFAAQRADRTSQDPTSLSDHVLMPDVGRGWAWEVILDADDHPRFSPVPRNRAEIAARLERQRLDFVAAREDHERLRAFKESSQRLTLPTAPPDGHEWRRKFSEAGHTDLTRTVVRDADLTALHFDGWRFDEVRFERCKLDRSIWRNCQFNSVYFVDCSCTDATLNEVVWQSGAFVRSRLQRNSWSDITLERVNIEDCELDDLAVAGGKWALVAVQGQGGVRGSVRDAVWESVTWNGVDARNWAWERLRADDLGLVECKMADLMVLQCSIVKPSVLLSDLSASVWQKSTLSTAVLSHGTSIERARMTDCVFKTSNFQDLRAHALVVDHCSFLQFNAQHLQAERSSWTSALLDGANVSHAHLVGSTFDRCSLREATFYGADMRETRMQDCNLIRARTSWAYLPESDTWRGNLNVGRLDFPRRER